MTINLQKIGKVTHFYDKISVAIVDLQNSLAKGDKIRFTRGGEDLFDQDVSSLQIDHKEVEKAGKGDVIGLQVSQKLKPDTEVFLVNLE